MAEFTSEQQHAFCQFVTGAPRLPPGGLSILTPKLTIFRKLEQWSLRMMIYPVSLLVLIILNFRHTRPRKLCTRNWFVLSSKRWNLPPPPDRQTCVSPARLPRQQALARPPHRRSLPRPLPRVPSISTHAGLPLFPGLPFYFPSQRAAVLCAVSGCDHRACHDGPFQVVLVALESDGGCYVSNSMSSPKTGEWRKHYSGRHDFDSDLELWSKTPYNLDLAAYAYIEPLAPVLVEDALHFMLSYEDDDVGILKYDLGTKCLSLIDAPLAETHIARDVILIAMEDGSLGFARVDRLTLNLWSRQMGYEGVETWTQHIIINFKELLPIRNPEKRLRLIGSVEGCDIVFVTTDLGIYQIHLKSLQWKKIWKREKYRALFPYMRF